MTAISSSKIALGLILITLVSQCSCKKDLKTGLNVGFYNGKCGKTDIENVIFDTVKEMYAEKPDTAADLVRLTFHDCFANGCDGSIFLDGKDTEKAAGQSLTLGGFEDIDEIKEVVEKVCPGVVSCADLLMIAARSAVLVAGGNWFAVETGRRDSLVSLKSDAAVNIPEPGIPIPKAIQIFAQRGLDKNDMAVLIGGHTLGTAHCGNFDYRLYNYQKTNQPDPTISPTLLQVLQQTCPRKRIVNNEAFLDQTPGSHFTFNNDYYTQIIANNGTLEIDQQLALHKDTKGIVKGLASNHSQFLKKFGQALVKMGRIGVLTGDQGEVRKSCRLRN